MTNYTKARIQTATGTVAEGGGMRVVPITKAMAEHFVLIKHYSRRQSIFWEGFGLVEDGKVVGVCVYGQPSPPIQKHDFKDRDFRLYELARAEKKAQGTKPRSKYVEKRLIKIKDSKIKEQ